MASLFTVYQLYLNSRFRSSGIIADFTTILPNPISCMMTDFVSEFRLTIPTASVPYSFHEINDLNHTVSYSIVRGAFVGSQTFPIANGTYDIITLATVFTSDLIASVGSLVGAYSPIINFVYNYDKNKLTFNLTYDGTSTAITLNATTGFTQVLLSLGFNATALLDDISPLESFVSCNVSPSRSLFILSNNLINGRSYDGYVSEMRTSNVLCCIPMNSTRYDYIVYNPPVLTVNTLTNKTIDKINLYLQTESLDAVLPDMDLNWSLQMTFEVWIFQNIQRVLPTSQVDTDRIQKLTDERNMIIDELNSLKSKLSNGINKENVKSKKTNTQITTGSTDNNESTTTT